MADYTSRHVTTVRREYALPIETNWAEIDKVFAAMRNELGEERAQYDDAVRTRVTDDEIVFWYEKSSEVTHG
jgi:hypothetical protein